ncbi:MAG: hypothetical protein EBZ47_08555, partial [Chlamydiae bacterium]|nr:hypothetical protein [Chlamydiota bacterium]
YWNTRDAKWKAGYSELQEFFKLNKHVRVPQKHLTSSGYRLGNWVTNQRANKQNLTPDQKSKLESLEGWLWDTKKSAWDDALNELLLYEKKFKTTLVPFKYISPNNFKLGTWVNKIRSKRKELTLDKINQLEQIPNWVWSVLDDKWEAGYEALNSFYNEYKHLKIPAKLVLPNGYALGSWVDIQKNSFSTLDKERTRRLELVPGWTWLSRYEEAWNNGYEELKKFCIIKNTSRVPFNFVSESGYKLGAWVIKQRSKKEKLPKESIAKLENLPEWAWAKKDK